MEKKKIIRAIKNDFRPFDILLYSKKARELVIERMEKNSISQSLLCEKSKVNEKLFAIFLQQFDPARSKSGRNFKQEHLLRIMKNLKIKVKLLLIKEPFTDDDLKDLQ